MLYLYIILHKKGYQKMNVALYFLCCFHYNLSPMHSFSCVNFRFNKVIIYWFQLFSLNSSSLFSLYCSLLFSSYGNISFYCQLFYIVIMWQLNILLSVIHCFHHVATQYPGHSTKFVMLPSSILL